MKKLMLLTGLALFLQGCSYAISPALTSQADKTLSLHLIEQDPGAHAGKIVILGGTIIRTANTDHGTLIEVEARALDYWGKPLRTKRTGGRFLLRYPAALNSFQYAPGRELTAAAQVAGNSRALDDSSAPCPFFLSKELKLWKDERKARTGPQWIDPLHDPNASVQTQW